MLPRSYEISFGDDKDVLKLDYGSKTCTTLWIYLIPLNCRIKKSKLHAMWIISQQNCSEKKNSLKQSTFNGIPIKIPIPFCTEL